MKKKFISIIAVCFIFICFFYGITISQPIPVKKLNNEELGFQDNAAWGYGMIVNGDISRARNQAIDDALKRLVKKRLKKLFDSKVYLRISPLLLESVLIEVEPFIESFRVLSEEEGEHVYMVLLEAHIYEKVLKRRILKMGFPLKDTSPRVLVMIVERIDERPPFFWWSGLETGVGRINSMIGGAFRETGFTVINPFSPPIIDLPLNARTPYLNRKDLERFGSIFGADIILYGEMGLGKRGIPFFFRRKEDSIWLKFKVFLFPSGEEILSETTTINPVKSSPLELKSIMSYERILWDVSNRSIPRIVSILRKKEENRKIIEATFIGVKKYKEYSMIKKAIEDMEEMVKSVTLMSFSRGRFSMEINVKVESSIFLKSLQERRWEGFALRIVEHKGRNVVLKIIPQGEGL